MPQTPPRYLCGTAVRGAPVGGGYNAGTPPTVVQSVAGNTGGATGGGAGLTLGSGPVSGNLLIAMTFNPTSDSVGAGWTQLVANGSGTDFGAIFYKRRRRRREYHTDPDHRQGTVNAPAAMAMWEINGQNADHRYGSCARLFWTVEAEQTGQIFAQSLLLPSLKNCLFLGAIGLVSTSTNLVSSFGVTQDQILQTGTGRQIVAGHSTLGTEPMGQILATSERSEFQLQRHWVY